MARWNGGRQLACLLQAGRGCAVRCDARVSPEVPEVPEADPGFHDVTVYCCHPTRPTLQ